MTKWSLLCVLAVGCAAETPDLGEVESEVVPVTGQGVTWQGVTWQGVTWQGVTWQGVTWQGTSLANVQLGGPRSATLAGTALSLWKQNPDFTWEERRPDRICTWDRFKFFLHGCTTYNLATQPSPLAGAEFTATFKNPDGTTFPGTLRIGTSTSDLTAVHADTQTAMFPLTGNQYAGNCPVVACTNPAGCSVNCDVWLYDIRLVDANVASICPAGESATAFANTYDATAARSSVPGQFTFGCTNGTLAKCARWGYRPYGSARHSCSQAGCTTTDTTLYPLADYHQACVRAAMADYCANGNSFTQNGTIVDIWDYVPGNTGFVPRTRDGLVYDYQATGLVWEGEFDMDGAMQIDHLRYAELTDTGTYGDIDDPVKGCPGKFSPTGTSDDIFHCTSNVPCWVRDPTTWKTPWLGIYSTPACSHSEQTRGRWLHPGCSQCTRDAPVSCTTPTGSWDAACVQWAQDNCGANGGVMAPHSECTTGGSLSLYQSGCTMKLCLDPHYKSCCGGTKASWSSTCVTAANQKCTGGGEGRVIGGGEVGFCGTSR